MHIRQEGFPPMWSVFYMGGGEQAMGKNLRNLKNFGFFKEQILKRHFPALQT